MPGRTTHARSHLSPAVASVLWTGALCGAWHAEDREKAMCQVWLAAAVAATVVVAIGRAHSRDIVDAHWAGYAARKHLDRPDEAG